MRQEEIPLEQFLTEQIKGFLERIFPSQSAKTLDDEAAIIFLTDLLGIPPERWRENPDLAPQSIHHLVGQLAEVLGFIFSSDASQIREARQRMRQLSQHLAAAGLHFDATQLEELPDKLHRWYMGSSDKESFTAIVTQLQAFAQKKPYETQTLTAELQELIRSLYAKEDPNVRYYERGRQAVRDSLKPRKFDVKQVLAAHKRKKKEQDEA